MKAIKEFWCRLFHCKHHTGERQIIGFRSECTFFYCPKCNHCSTKNHVGGSW